MKRILFVLGGLAVVLLLALGLATACVVRNGHHFSFGITYDKKATRTEEHALDIATGQLLSVEVPGGKIHVKASPDAKPSVSATLTAYGNSQEMANENLAAAKLEITSSTDGLKIRLADDKQEKIFSNIRLGHTASADLEIRVPAAVRLELSSSSGDVDAEGPFADTKAHSAYGSVRVQDVEGDLAAASSSGDVRVSRVRGKSLSAKSGYGKVEVADCESGEIEARSSSGDVRILTAKSERLEVGSGYGDVEMKNVGGEIEAKLASGDVRLQDWKGSRARLSTSYGHVEVERAAGTLEATSSSGDVEVRDFEGALEAKSSYGALRLDGVFSGLEAQTQSGDVHARAREGSRTDGRWKLASAYGGVELLVPETFSCDLDAKTAYGRVDVDLEITVRPGNSAKKGDQAIAGKVNGGGGRVELRCQSGDVRVAPAGK